MRAVCLALAAAAFVRGALLPPMAWSPLPHGTFAPEGWLYRQLRIQADGLSGNFAKFWEPITNNQWTSGSSVTEDWVEIFPYVFAGYVPQAIMLRDPAQIAQAQSWIDAIIERQTPEGWLGPPDAERSDHGMRYWPQWPIVLSFLAWHEFGKTINGTADPRLLTSCLQWLHNASGMLDTLPMGRDWSGTRWQDFVQAAQAVMDCPETPDSEQAFLQALSAKAYDQGVKNGIDWAKFYAGPDFPKDAVPGWDYLPHGVNNGMAAKGGAVTWRGGLDPDGNVSSYVRDSVLMTYHGSPAGIFTADECLAGRMPSKGTETCAVVEQLYSLNVVHEIQGDPFFADRAERIAYNALPATGTKDMWSRVYLQQQNEVFAGHTSPHVWNTDGDDSTTYSLAGNYMCCTANFNQGWSRFIAHALHAAPGGGLAVTHLAPMSATLAGGVFVNVSGDYPFNDDVTIALSNLPAGPLAFPLFVRVPGWATAATLSVNGGAPVAVGAANGTMLRVDWAGASGPSAAVTLATNPAVRVEPWFNGALAVFRGALLYSLRLDENFVNTTAAAGEPRATDWVVAQPGCDKPNGGTCAAPWNAALVVADPAHAEAGFAFRRTGDVPAVPFAAGLWGASNLELTATVRLVSAWGVNVGAAQPPPASPVDCSAAGACGETFTATFVPYGATHLRMTQLPWTGVPPCGSAVAYNGSASAVLSGTANDFDTYAGADIEPNGADENIRSGDPGDVSTAAWLTTVQDPAHAITGARMSFQ